MYKKTTPFPGLADTTDEKKELCENKKGEFCDWFYKLDDHARKGLVWAIHHGVSGSRTGPKGDNSCSGAGKLCFISLMYYNINSF